jgi:LacI family transcriptional regulator
VSVKTADHVRSVALDLGYRDDSPFRSLSQGIHRTIALAVTDVTNPFYFGTLRGAQNEAIKADYSILLIDAQESASQERTNLERLLPMVDGLIVASSRLTDTLLRSVAKSHPIVILNRFVGGLPSVLPDTAHGMKLAVSHLLQLGHTSVYFLPGPDSSWMSGMRWLTLRAAAIGLGMTLHRLNPVPPTIEGGATAAEAILARQATAVICYNDLNALGLIKALRSKGASLPRDISVIGCDNLFADDLITPALTTLAAPTGLLGETAVRFVLSMIEDVAVPSSSPTTVPMRLIVRESTGRAPLPARSGHANSTSQPAPCKDLS